MRLTCLFAILIIFNFSCNQNEEIVEHQAFDMKYLLSTADEMLKLDPITITSFEAKRSQGGKNDYYSEGRYWWPDSTNLDGPYVRRDGLSNPQLFTKHKSAVKDFEKLINTLTVATMQGGDEKYLPTILMHLDAWFVNPETRMNPTLLYAQAIKGIVDGRGIGMIDVIGFINIANGVRLLDNMGMIKDEEIDEVRKWFDDFAVWANTHPYGLDEKNNNNNHSTWWGAQVAAYALVAENQDLMDVAEEQFKRQVAIQMEADGSFPDELARTKPSHYTNYNLFAWTSFAHLFADRNFNPWEYESDKGSIMKAINYTYGFFVDPSKWTMKTDLESEFDSHNTAFLYLTYLETNDYKYFEEWSRRNPKEGSKRADLLIWKMIIDND